MSATAKGDSKIARRPFRQAPVQTGPRANEQIDVPEVRLIGSDGSNHDVVATDRALEMARDEGLDLVEISPNAKPPVCKILDYGKFKYKAQKKAAEARKKQKTIDVKEIKMRPNIDIHDYEVKMRNVRRFLDNGDKVKVTIRFRGREMAHQNLGMKLLIRVKQEIEDLVKIELEPKMEGRQMIMIMAPK